MSGSCPHTENMVQCQSVSRPATPWCSICRQSKMRERSGYKNKGGTCKFYGQIARFSQILSPHEYTLWGSSSQEKSQNCFRECPKNDICLHLRNKLLKQINWFWRKQSKKSSDVVIERQGLCIEEVWVDWWANKISHFTTGDSCLCLVSLFLFLNHEHNCSLTFP